MGVSQPVRMHRVHGVSVHSPFTRHKYGLFLDRLEMNIYLQRNHLSLDQYTGRHQPSWRL